MEQWTQNKIITFFLTPLAKISARFSEKTKDRIFVASGFMIFFMTFIFGSQYSHFRYFYAFAFDCLMLGIMILCSLRQDVKPIEFDKKLLILGFVFGLSALISGIFLDTDYLSHAILCLITYPVIYIVWNNIDVTHVFGLLLKISKLSFLFFSLVHFLFYPIESRKYSGIIGNTNYYSFFLVLFACCFFLELIIGKKNRRDYIFLLSCYGLNSALLFYTNSRTGLLAVILSHVFSIILLLIIFRRTFWKLYAKRIIALVLSVIFFIPITIFIFQIPKFCVGIIQQITLQLDTNPTPSADPATSSDPDKNEKSPFTAAAETLENIQDTWTVKTSTDGKDLVRISSGRIDIWKGFLLHLRFTGHAKSDTFTFVKEGVEEEATGTAHMMILQYAYQFGILAGVCFLGINLIAGIKSILYALKFGKHEIITLFPFLISIAYGVISMLSSIGSFSVFIGLYYFLVQTPFVKKSLGENSNA